jgi:hypothetical protein
MVGVWLQRKIGTLPTNLQTESKSKQRTKLTSTSRTMKQLMQDLITAGYELQEQPGLVKFGAMNSVFAPQKMQ